nr:GGDEF domain-containing protein [uncultured Gellertiella sp.]
MALSAAVTALVASSVLLPVLSTAGMLSISSTQIVQIAAIIAAITGMVGGWMGMRVGRTIEHLKLSRARFERLSRLDALSGLLNRRAFAEALERAEEGASLVIIDVDRFKSINDAFGHAAGDRVIQRVASLLQAAGGEGLPVGRLGGEEFGMLLTEGSPDERIVRVDALRERIASTGFSCEQGNFQVTISAGMAEIGHGQPLDLVFAAADKALYLAKAGGRNRVVHDREGLALILDMVAAERFQEDAGSRSVALPY